MKRKLFIVLASGLMFGILAGCNQVEDILSQLNQLLDNQLEENETVEEDNEQTENDEEEEVQSVQSDQSDENNDNAEENGNNAAENNVADEGTDDLPFHERLLSQGYNIKVLPNGFPFDVPYHWVLVDETVGDDGSVDFKFCYDLPLDTQEVANYFDSFDGINHEYHGENEDIIMTTTYELDPDYPVNGTMEYMIDDYNNTCVNVTVDFGGEVNLEVPNIEQSPVMENETVVIEDRERSLPDNYDEALSEIQGNHEMEASNVDLGDILSIRDKINNNEIEMHHLTHGLPTIFPYEWYMMNPEGASGGFPGTFCTDTPLNQAVISHLDMLENNNANIDYLATSGSVKPNVLTEVGFAFNDAYGTGSWKGVSLFFITPEDDGTYPLHRCVTVDMEFSDEILD